MRNWLPLLLLAGCSSVQWDKPGTSAELVQADARACGAAAQSAAFLPKPQTTMTAAGTVVVTESNDPADANRQIQEAQRVETCMRQKGYTLKAG